MERARIEKRKFTSLSHVLLLLLLGGSLLFINLGNRPLGGSEGRWGVIAKEMLLTHDWIVPRINGVPYRDKPVGSYWLIALLSLPQHGVTEWTTRLPSAAATLLSLLLLYFICRAFWSPQAALWAALAFMTTFPVLRWGRTANADTLTITGTLACLYLFVKNKDHPETAAWLYLFFAIAGITSLMKGLLGFVLPSLAVFPYLLLKHRDLFFKKHFLLHLLAASALGGILFLIPFYLDYRATHSDMSLYLVFKENIVRFFHPFDHKEPFYFYFYYIFVTLSPWVLFAPFLVWSLKKNGLRSDDGVFFFSLWFLAMFVFFTLSGSKRGYYILPLTAPFSAILGYFIVRALRPSSPSSVETILWSIPPLSFLLSGGLSLALLIIRPGGLVTRVPSWAFPTLYVAAACLLIAGSSFAWVRKGAFSKALFTFFAGTYLLMAVFFDFLALAKDMHDSFLPFCKAVNAVTKRGKVGVFNSADQSKVYFYLDERPPIACLYTPLLARGFLTFHRDAYLIVKGTEDLDKLKSLPYKIVLKEGRKSPKAFYLITLSHKNAKRNRIP